VRGGFADLAANGVGLGEVQQVPGLSFGREAGRADLLGQVDARHADPSITRRVYAHVIGEQLAEVAAIFARAVEAG
jgi:hypothetical protein